MGAFGRFYGGGFGVSVVGLKETVRGAMMVLLVAKAVRQVVMMGWVAEAVGVVEMVRWVAEAVVVVLMARLAAEAAGGQVVVVVVVHRAVQREVHCGGRWCSGLKHGTAEPAAVRMRRPLQAERKERTQKIVEI